MSIADFTTKLIEAGFELSSVYMSFDGDHYYDECNYYVSLFVHETVENKKYEREMRQFEKQMVKYKKDLLVYENEKAAFELKEAERNKQRAESLRNEAARLLKEASRLEENPTNDH